ncbi:MAG: hypothetical protein QM493_00070 [Sulfurovum sp.]
MRSLLVIVILSSILLGSVYKEHCKYCHSSKISLAKIYTKKDWYEITNRSDNTLKNIHKRNLDVFDYLSSKEYNPVGLYDNMSFFAKKSIKSLESKKTKKTKEPYSSCIECHRSKITLSKLWQLSQWKALLTSDKTLKAVHKKAPIALDYINSKEYSKRLPKLIKSVEFYAPNMQIIELKQGKISLTFKKNNGKKEEAKNLFEEIQKSLRGCKIDNNINLHLSISNQDTSVASAIFSAFTLFIAPIESSYTWRVEAQQNSMTFSSTIDIKYSSGFFGKDHKSLVESIDKLMSDLKKKMNIRCKSTI